MTAGRLAEIGHDWEDASDLVDDDERMFRVHSDVYNSPEVFALEMDAVFSSTWVYVAHASEIENVGDYKTTLVGQQPVIVSRHEDGNVHVLFNRCRHRGTVVCRDDTGHSNYFRCPYHNWVYANDGALVGVSMADGYLDDFPKDQFGLQSVARVESYRGLIFVSLASSGPSLDEYLGGLKHYIDLWAERSPIGEMKVLPTIHKHYYPGNWKWQCENGTDSYHGNYVHDSWQRVLQRAGEGKVKDVRKYRMEGANRGFAYGHGMIERPADLNPNSSWTGRLMAANSRYANAMRARYDRERLQEICTKLIIYIFPNLYLFDTHIRVVTPLAHKRTEVRFYPYDLGGTPDEVNVSRLRAHERFFGPAGFGTPDDNEIFTASETGLRATHVDWLLFNRGQHREVVRDGQRLGETNDETGARSLYREWKRLMAGTAGSGGWAATPERKGVMRKRRGVGERA